jgi:poly(beta-D-mannuronate) lyase
MKSVSSEIRLTNALALGFTIAASVSVSAADNVVRTAADIRQASRTVRPGDTLIMADGVWRDADLVFEATGTAEKPITLRAQTPGRVVMTGKSRLRLSGRHLVVEGLWFKDGPAGAVR